MKPGETGRPATFSHDGFSKINETYVFLNLFTVPEQHKNGFSPPESNIFVLFTSAILVTLVTNNLAGVSLLYSYVRTIYIKVLT